jgi:hypothetical protein
VSGALPRSGVGFVGKPPLSGILPRSGMGLVGKPPLSGAFPRSGMGFAGALPLSGTFPRSGAELPMARSLPQSGVRLAGVLAGDETHERLSISGLLYTQIRRLTATLGKTTLYIHSRMRKCVTAQAVRRAREVSGKCGGRFDVSTSSDGACCAPTRTRALLGAGRCDAESLQGLNSLANVKQ